MSFRLKGRPELADELYDLARGRVDAALKALRDAGDPHESVHKARKRFKEMRAILRLFRPALGRKVARYENAWYRDHARAFSGFRDAQAVIETCAALEQRFQSPEEQDVLQHCRDALTARRDRLAGGGGDLHGQIDQLVAELREARDRITVWPCKAKGAEGFGNGFQRCYARGADALQACRVEGDVEDWHAWRKRVKDYWYHVQILQPLWPAVFQTLEAELKTLSDLLGDDHDLDVLESLLRTEPDHVAEAHRRSMYDMIAQRHRELRVPALQLGRRLYVDSPGTMAYRLRCWWAVWRDELKH